MMVGSGVPRSRYTTFADFFVNIFPALSYVPEWFPGTRWKQKVREWRADKEQAMNELFEWTKAQVVCREIQLLVPAAHGLPTGCRSC